MSLHICATDLVAYLLFNPGTSAATDLRPWLTSNSILGQRLTGAAAEHKSAEWKAEHDKAKIVLQLLPAISYKRNCV